MHAYFMAVLSERLMLPIVGNHIIFMSFIAFSVRAILVPPPLSIPHR